MRFILIVLVFLGTSTILLAQKDTLRLTAHHQISISASPAFGYWQDVMFSPLNYQTRGALYQLGYSRENRNQDALFRATIDFGSGPIVPTRSDLALFNSDYLAGNLTLDYLKLVPQKVDKLRFFAGPQYQLNVSYFDYLAQDSFSFVASHTLDAAALLQYPLGSRHNISTGVSAALVGLLVRPPYAGYNTQLLNNYENRPLRLIVDGGRFASLHNYQFVRWQVDYQFGLTAKTKLVLHYAFVYQRVQDRFHPFVQAVNQLGGGITFTL